MNEKNEPISVRVPVTLTITYLVEVPTHSREDLTSAPAVARAMIEDDALSTASWPVQDSEAVAGTVEGVYIDGRWFSAPPF